MAASHKCRPLIAEGDDINNCSSPQRSAVVRESYKISNKTKILILGGGFGGVYAALRLDKTLTRRADVEVTLVSCDNFLLSTPMTLRDVELISRIATSLRTDVAESNVRIG
ncbi:MAG TPA: hypothetical protein VGW77_28050 [Candidatus Binatia bacterium]|jgi:hypothetical protein|nr:hypothetical protein [Candidatus Binatia bacterium]